MPRLAQSTLRKTATPHVTTRAVAAAAAVRALPTTDQMPLITPQASKAASGSDQVHNRSIATTRTGRNLRIQPARAAKARAPDHAATTAEECPATSHFRAGIPGSPTTTSETESDDAFATMENDLALEGEGLECTLHTYESRFNSKGEHVRLQTGSKSELDYETDKSTPVALVLTRYYNSQKALESTRLEIQSPYIKAALRNVVGTYPSVNINSSRNIVMKDDPRCLFHYHEQLKAYAEASEDPNVYRHVSFALRYMFRALRKEILAYGNTMNCRTLAPGLEFDHLWMAYRPGELVYDSSSKAGNIYRLTEMVKVFEHEKFIAWKLKLDRIFHDGKVIGFKRNYSFEINLYDGYRPLTELIVFPLRYHSDEARVRRDLILRGKKYVSLIGIHYRMYSGKADMYDHVTPLSSDSTRKETINVQHRVMIDAREFHWNHQKSLGLVGDRNRVLNQTNPSDEELLMCHSHVPGFSLTLKRWGWFDVDLLTDVQYNVNAFQSLVLSAEKKEMMRSIVNHHEQVASSNFDDLVEGKGKGLIMLLHGPPGVGKTFTAESIAEFARRPLYQVNCGDLGYHSSIIEKQLDRVLSLAAKWEAVVLIDEADVFLSERKPSELDRSALVSVFLRTLEYFEGILFLATNKVAVIDSAVQSRVHFSIAYPDLDFESRKQLWRVFAVKAADGLQPDWLDDEYLNSVSEMPINGRQIKNAARVAHALAATQKRALLPEDMKSTLRALISFDNDFRQHTSQRQKNRRMADAAASGSADYDAKGPPAPAEEPPRKRRKTRASKSTA